MTTIGDVAKAAGVSVATVSRALRGVDRVSPRTRDRVLAAATELHYVASPAATSLVSGRTRGIGVITPYFNRWFFATVVTGIEKALRDDGHHVLLCDLESHTFDTRLPITQNLDDFTKGMIDTTHLAYYLSFIAFGLFLTAKSVDSERWRG